MRVRARPGAARADEGAGPLWRNYPVSVFRLDRTLAETAVVPIAQAGATRRRIA